MNTPVYLDPSKKHDFIWLFDCKNGNPNGDPDADNFPRQDIHTGNGFVTDACLKRKIRNFAQMHGENIFVAEGAVLNNFIKQAVIESGLTDKLDPKKEKLIKEEDVAIARQWMCQKFFDIRMFGAVLSTGQNAGQVRGPLQLTFAESITPIYPQNITITRCAATEQNDIGKDNKTMGRKSIIPYGLYLTYGFYSPQLGRQTGVSNSDLNLLWEAILHCFEFDRAAARGLMATRNLWIFTHESPLGNAPAHKLFSSLSISPKKSDIPPRLIEDFSLTFTPLNLPGISCNSML